MKSMFGLVVQLLAAMFLASSAYAHTGAHTAFSLQSGLLHPFHGLDHLLAMFAVGLFAAQLGGRAIYLVPGAFVAMMLGGALAGFAGLPVPGFEWLIAASVVAVALPVAFALGMPASFAMGYVGFFALFHGFAHGAELPVGADAAPFMLGFAVSTALIHALGIAAAVAFGRSTALGSKLGVRFVGGAIAIAGIVLAI